MTAASSPATASTSEISAESSVGCAKSRAIGSLRHNFDLPATEQSFIHGECSFDKILWAKLNVSKAFRVAVNFITENRDAVDWAASMEVRLQFLGRRSVVHISYVDAAIVNFHFLFYGQNWGGGRTVIQINLVTFTKQSPKKN